MEWLGLPTWTLERITRIGLVALHLHRDAGKDVLIANLHSCKYEVLHKAVVNCGYNIQAEDDNVRVMTCKNCFYCTSLCTHYGMAITVQGKNALLGMLSALMSR